MKRFECDCDVIHAEVVEKVKKNMPDIDLLMDLADFFKVFSDSTRVRILVALSEDTMCVCDIACLLNMTKSSISHQLRILRQANLVKTRKKGKNVYYTLKDDHVKEIISVGLEHILE